MGDGGWNGWDMDMDMRVDYHHQRQRQSKRAVATVCALSSCTVSESLPPLPRAQRIYTESCLHYS